MHLFPVKVEFTKSPKCGELVCRVDLKSASIVSTNFSDNPHTLHAYMSPVKRICVFEHSVMTYFNCACPAIQRGQGSGFLSEDSS